MYVYRMIRKFFKFIFKLVLGFVLLSALWVVIYKYVPVPYTPLMVIRSMDATDDHEIKHTWVSIKEISTYLQLAVVCAEDQKFSSHNGFDRAAIEKAFKSNQQGKRLRGGSTISQQTAKNAFLWPDRSWLRKGLESWFTFLIEQIWTKERILEVYLNSIEMGNGVYGAQAAAQYWFQKDANDLSRREAACLAAILPNPRNYSANPPSLYVEKRAQWIVKQMRNYGTFNLE